MKIKIFIYILLINFSSFVWSENQIPGNDFNSYVLNVLKSYPTNGTHQYHWPKGGSWGGNTCDLYYPETTLFAKGDPLKRCYCCGLTFEVFFKAYKNYCKDQGWPFIIKDFDAKKLLSFRKQWFGSDGNKKTHYNAIIANKLGFAVTLEKAQMGDFVQFWRHSGSGHSVIFIGWIYSRSQKIIGLQYWSTQKSTGGIGYRTEYIGKNSGIDKSQIYIARIGKKTVKK